MAKLTDKQEAFAQLLAREVDEVDAYLRSYNVTTSKPASIKAMASRTARNAKIMARVEELRAMEHQRHTQRIIHNEDGITREWIMGRLKEEAEAKDNSGAVRVRAVELIAKAEGVFEDHDPQETTARSVEEMERKILRKLHSLLPLDPSLPQA